MENHEIAKGFILFFLLIISVSVHEWAHAYAAHKMGDNTPQLMGRLTLNPLPHLELLGSIILPLLCIFSSSGILIGWGKPVHINLKNFKHPNRGDIVVSLAGVFGNLMICLLASLLMGVSKNVANYSMFSNLIYLNALLIVLNLLPIPPLDGSWILRHVLKIKESTYNAILPFGFIILIVLINMPWFSSIFIKAIKVIYILFANIAIHLHALIY